MARLSIDDYTDFNQPQRYVADQPANIYSSMPMPKVDGGAVGGHYYPPDPPPSLSPGPSGVPTPHTTTPTYNAAPDLSSQLSDVYRQYGLDPNNPGAGLGDLNYFMGRANATNPNDINYWTNRLGQEITQWRGGGTGNLIPNEGGGGGAAASGGGYGGTSVFSDPATQAYEKLLNGLIGRFNTPYTPPSMGNTLNYLNSYFQQLQGPAYTPAQMDLMQTQAIDPLERQHEQARQNMITQLGTRGISPSSGIAQEALQKIDNQFASLDAQSRAGFANNAIGMQKQQFAQAAALGPQISSLEQQNYNNQNQNMLQAASLASIVPQLAWSRLQGANNAIQPLNPSSLLSPLYSFQTQGYNQGSDYMSAIMQALAQAFGVGG